MTTTRETADHAELARRLREDADWQRKMKGGTTNDRMLDQAADALENLLSEIAALRGEVEQTEAKLADVSEQCSQWIAKADEETDRAIQAERQRDELRNELEFIRGVVTPDQGSCMTDIERVIFARISRILANQGADQ